MADKNIRSRMQQKHDISSNWALATNFVPLAGEIIVYSDLNKFKIGDGVTLVGALPFATSDISDFVGATSSTAGEHGLVPAPQAGDEGKYLKGDGTWGEVSLGQSKYKTSIVGDGETTQFTITHNLDSIDVIVVIYDDYLNDAVADIRRVDADTILVEFAEAPALKEAFTIVCILPGGSKGETGDGDMNTNIYDPTAAVSSQGGIPTYVRNQIFDLAEVTEDGILIIHPTV